MVSYLTVHWVLGAVHDNGHVQHRRHWAGEMRDT